MNNRTWVIFSMFSLGLLLLGIAASYFLVNSRLFLGSKATPITTQADEPTATPAPGCNDIDIMLVLDRSSSMNVTEFDGRTKLAWAKEAAQDFAITVAGSNLAGPNLRIGLSSFGAQGNDGTGHLAATFNSTLNSAPIANYSDLQSQIAALAFIQPGTCIECGLRIANNQLASSTSQLRYLILLSDGRANHTWDGTSSVPQGLATAVTEANSGRSQNIIYYTIGYGQGAQINEPELIAIAGNSANYFYRPNVVDWSTTFIAIANQLLVTSACPTPTPSPIPTLVPTSTPLPVPSPTLTSTPTPSDVPPVSPTPTQPPVDTPLPTPTPQPVLYQCLKIDIYRGTILIAPDQLLPGDQVIFRAFATATQTVPIPQIRFTLTIDGTAQEPVYVPTTLQSDTYHADLPVTLGQSGSYSIQATPVK